MAMDKILAQRARRMTPPDPSPRVKQMADRIHARAIREVEQYADAHGWSEAQREGKIQPMVDAFVLGASCAFELATERSQASRDEVAVGEQL